MKKLFYYHRDENRKPIETVCLISHSGMISKGIAICSKKDNPCKKHVLGYPK